MRKKNFLFIAFTGVDGTGKTLQAKKLAKYFISQNINTGYIWLGWDPIFLRWETIIKREDKNFSRDFSEKRQRKGTVFKSKMLLFFYAVLTTIDFIVRSHLAIIKMRIKNVVITDRYLYDILAHLFVISQGKYKDVLRSVNRMMKKFVPSPDLILYFKCSSDIIFQRKKDIYSLDYLDEYIKAYEYIMNNVIKEKVRKIDCFQGIDDIFKKIILACKIFF